MPATLKETIESLIEQRNEPVLEQHRDYYQYLVQENKTDGETLEEHIARYADFVRCVPIASEAELTQLVARIGSKLPEELSTFYRQVGGLRGQGIKLFSPGELLAMLSDDAPRFEHIASIGLTHMMRLAWGNDRWELDAEGRLLTQTETNALNSRYRCVGWRWVDEESASFLYFDDDGQFGKIFYHQDAFDELLDGDLRPMLLTSPATLKLEEVVLAWLRGRA